MQLVLQTAGGKLVNLTNGTAYIQATQTIQALSGNNLTLGAPACKAQCADPLPCPAGSSTLRRKKQPPYNGCFAHAHCELSKPQQLGRLAGAACNALACGHRADTVCPLSFWLSCRAGSPGQHQPFLPHSLPAEWHQLLHHAAQQPHRWAPLRSLICCS